jgi:DNA-binding NarL/FixJ family response regulator
MQDATSLVMLEAASQLSETDHEVMRGIARAAAAVTAQGAVAVARFDAASRLDPSSVQFERADLRFVLRFHDWQRAAAGDAVHVLAHAPCAITARSDLDNEYLFNYLDRARTLVSLCVMCNTGDGGGIHIVFGQSAVRDWPPARIDQLRVCAQHVALAWRLRSGLGAADDPAGTPPREGLRRAVRGHAEQAEAEPRPTARTAVLWPELVAGRWSLVDGFTAPGGRYLVAHRNPDGAEALRALTPREQRVLELALAGRSGKWTAFELALSESAVARTLRTALRKLGAADTAVLAGLHTATFSDLAGAAAGVDLAIARLTSAADTVAGLSIAERAVVTGILGGKRITAIAHERGTSPRTVAHQIASVYRKLGASSRRELVALLG